MQTKSQSVNKQIKNILEKFLTDFDWNNIQWNDIKWEESSFDWKKAYICSGFAKIAYLHIAEYESRNIKRVKNIPCAEYRAILRESRAINVREIFQGLDEIIFIVETRYLIANIITIQNITFISIRGTQELYDWFVNLNCLKSNIFGNKNIDILFHKGYYRAIVPCIPKIISEILSKSTSKSQIYITGHSLGGALSAILYSILSKTGLQYYPYCLINFRFRQHYSINSCYTFGMPRYGNFHAVVNFPSPYHIYNELDIVPTVPFRWLGFEDCPIEYCLNEQGITTSNNLSSISFLKWFFKFVNIKIKEIINRHDMELYIKRIQNIAEI